MHGRISRQHAFNRSGGLLALSAQVAAFANRWMSSSHPQTWRQDNTEGSKFISKGTPTRLRRVGFHDGPRARRARLWLRASGLGATPASVPAVRHRSSASRFRESRRLQTVNSRAGSRFPRGTSLATSRPSHENARCRADMRCLASCKRRAAAAKSADIASRYGHTPRGAPGVGHWLHR
jgi:hypothetical protein